MVNITCIPIIQTDVTVVNIEAKIEHRYST